jgi:hypothetical protein
MPERRRRIFPMEGYVVINDEHRLVRDGEIVKRLDR